MLLGYSSHWEGKASASGVFRMSGRTRWRIASEKTSRSDEHLSTTSIPSRLQQRGAGRRRQRQGLFLVLLWTAHAWMNRVDDRYTRTQRERNRNSIRQERKKRFSSSMQTFIETHRTWECLLVATVTTGYRLTTLFLPFRCLQAIHL